MPVPASVAQEDGLPRRNQAYLRDLVKLATVLGRAHAVRVTCNGRSDQYWRNHMRDLLDLEAPDRGGLRTSMARAFNDSYSAEQSVRLTCDPATVAAEATFASQGRALSEALAAHYFPKGMGPTQPRAE